MDKPVPIDFAIITILDIEFAAMRRHLENYERVTFDGDPVVYFRGTLPAPSRGGAYDVVLCQTADMGNRESGLATADILRHWFPQAIIVVGIAGGIEGRVERGDIVVSRDVVYYEVGKIRASGFESRAPQYLADVTLATRARHYEQSEWLQRIPIPRPDSDKIIRETAHIGTIACGEKIIDDPATVEVLKAQFSKLLAIDMEGAGVGYAAIRNGDNVSTFLEIRGISDFADGTKKDDEWRPYAAEAAAAFTAGFLSDGPIPTYKSRSSDALKAPVYCAVRAQSVQIVNPSEVEALLMQNASQVDDKLLDFMDLMTDGRLTNPQIAVSRLTDDNGVLAAALASGADESLAFYGQIHIPLAVLAGFLTTDRVPVRLFDFHPSSSPPSWQWPQQSDNQFPQLALSGTDRGLPIAVIRFSVSYRVLPEDTRCCIKSDVSEHDLSLETPERGIVRSEKQLDNYAAAFRATLDKLTRNDPAIQEFHVFYAGPVSLAFRLGQSISPSIHAPTVIWNYSRRYDWGINLISAQQRTESIVTCQSSTPTDPQYEH